MIFYNSSVVERDYLGGITAGDEKVEDKLLMI
jgi:hypothetical protein